MLTPCRVVGPWKACGPALCSAYLIPCPRPARLLASLLPASPLGLWAFAHTVRSSWNCLSLSGVFSGPSVQAEPSVPVEHGLTPSPSSLAGSAV